MKKHENVSRILGQWHEFSQKLALAGLTFNQLQKVIESPGNELGKKIVGLIEGRLDVKTREHIIDCDIDPRIPRGGFVHSDLQVWTHKKCGKLEFNLSNLDFYVSKEQQTKKDEVLTGENLLDEINSENKKTLNANVLDYLLENKYLIPNKWKKYGNSKDVRFIVFWGTIYRDPDNDYLFVRYLCWHDEDGWFSDLALIRGLNFHGRKPNYRYDQYQTLILKD